jgi:hypothetical protein
MEEQIEAVLEQGAEEYIDLKRDELIRKRFEKTA